MPPRISSALAVFEKCIQSSKQHANISIPSTLDFGGMQSSPALAPRRSVGQQTVFVRLSMTEDNDGVDEERYLDEEII